MRPVISDSVRDFSSMQFESVGPSAVRAIRQRDLLNTWIRSYVRRRELPALAEFQPACLDEERPDLMIYDIERDADTVRYRATYAGTRLIDSYGFSAVGHSLQDLLAPALWSHVEPIYRTCLEQAMPVYSTFTVVDVEGQLVDYERLMLPFGDGCDVRSMIASIKSICIDGRFVNKNLMRPEDHAPRYSLRAVIDRDLGNSRPVPVPAHDVVEV
jgi:hypothetical protein